MRHAVHFDPDPVRVRGGLLALGHRVKHRGDQMFPVARQADVHDAGPDRRRGEHRSVEYEVGCARQQRLVLPAGWLALHAVRHYDGRAAPRCHRAHLDSRREAGATSSGEPGPRDGVNQRLVPAGAWLRQRTVCVQVRLEPGRLPGRLPA